MGDHVILNVDRLIATRRGEEGSASYSEAARVPFPLLSSSPAAGVGTEKGGGEESLGGEEEEPLIQMVECRICQEEDLEKNLEVPCACSGSLKFAHRACIQRWCDEKGDITCEICLEQYNLGYTFPPPAHPDETTIDVNGGWLMTGSPLDLHEHRVFAVATAHHHLVDTEYDGYASNARGAAFLRSAALILMALLLLRHAMIITNAADDDSDDVDDASAYFSLFLLRAVGFLLPCYIMAWIITILQHRRERQDAALAATEVAFILSGQPTGTYVTVQPDSPATPQQEPQ